MDNISEINNTDGRLAGMFLDYLDESRYIVEGGIRYGDPDMCYLSYEGHYYIEFYLFDCRIDGMSNGVGIASFDDDDNVVFRVSMIFRDWNTIEVEYEIHEIRRHIDDPELQVGYATFYANYLRTLCNSN